MEIGTTTISDWQTMNVEIEAYKSEIDAIKRKKGKLLILQSKFQAAIEKQLAAFEHIITKTQEKIEDSRAQTTSEEKIAIYEHILARIQGKIDKLKFREIYLKIVINRKEATIIRHGW